MFILLGGLWFVRGIKQILFWLFLWQLKDYHLPRFVDHFRTHKGKRLVFNYINAIKIFLLLIFVSLPAQSGQGLAFSYAVSALFVIYLAELILFFKSILKKKAKRPVFTLKMAFLSAITFVSVIALLLWILSLNDFFQPILFLAFDILTPVVISAIVLLFQPAFVLLRNNILKRAALKLEKVKSVGGTKVIAITGSYGKTSTKEFLTTILSAKYRVLSTKEHQNSEIGVAKCILSELKPSHQVFIAEVGAYDKGKVKEVCRMLKPKIGIITGVNEQHLALFGSMENLLSAEGGLELAESLVEGGILVANGDNKYCVDLLKRAQKPSRGLRLLYSLSNKTVDPEIWSDSITVEKDHISFLALNKAGEMAPFVVKVLGKHNVQNLLGAILLAHKLGMSFGEIAEAVKKIRPEQGGMVVKKGKQSLDIIDSSYSANPDGVLADLDYLDLFKNKKIIVMPCLIELGEKSAAIHQKIGRKIGQVCDLAIVTTKDSFNDLEKGFNETKKPNARCLLCDNAQDAYSAVTLFAEAGSAVLLEGRVPDALINLLCE